MEYKLSCSLEIGLIDFEMFGVPGIALRYPFEFGVVVTMEWVFYFVMFEQIQMNGRWQSCGELHILQLFFTLRHLRQHHIPFII